MSSKIVEYETALSGLGLLRYIREDEASCPNAVLRCRMYAAPLLLLESGALPLVTPSAPEAHVRLAVWLANECGMKLMAQALQSADPHAFAHAWQKRVVGSGLDRFKELLRIERSLKVHELALIGGVFRAFDGNQDAAWSLYGSLAAITKDA